MNTDKQFNATRDGQMAMAYDASARAPAFNMNRIVKSRGGVGWPDDMISSANEVMLRAIKENLVEEFNALLSKKP